MAILPHGFRIVKSSCSVAKMSKPRSTTIINLDGVENAILRTQLHSNLIVVAAMGLYRNQPVEYIRMTGGYRQALVGGGSLPDWVEAGSMPRNPLSKGAACAIYVVWPIALLFLHHPVCLDSPTVETSCFPPTRFGPRVYRCAIKG